MCCSVAHSYRLAGQNWPWGSSDQAGSTYYPHCCRSLPFRFRSKSQWQSQLLNFSWSLKTQLIFLLNNIEADSPRAFFSVDTMLLLLPSKPAPPQLAACQRVAEVLFIKEHLRQIHIHPQIQFAHACISRKAFFFMDWNTHQGVKGNPLSSTPKATPA